MLFVTWMNVCFFSVKQLKDVIERSCGISVDKQVLLVSGGECLDPTARVCSYSAGTDTNPIYLFSKSTIESVTPPSLSMDFGTGSVYVPAVLQREVSDLFKCPISFLVFKTLLLCHFKWDISVRNLFILHRAFSLNGLLAHLGNIQGEYLDLRKKQWELEIFRWRASLCILFISYKGVVIWCHMNTEKYKIQPASLRF